jgi:hypothetical protein
VEYSEGGKHRRDHDRRADLGRHLPRQDPALIGALYDKMGDPMGEGVGLSGARSCDDPTGDEARVARRSEKAWDRVLVGPAASGAKLPFTGMSRSWGWSGSGISGP